jgi:hypothetical protein
MPQINQSRRGENSALLQTNAERVRRLSWGIESGAEIGSLRPERLKNQQL